LVNSVANASLSQIGYYYGFATDCLAGLGQLGNLALSVYLVAWAVGYAGGQLAGL
jgi:hypothetical protein